MASVGQDAQLPGWGIYVCGAFGGATSVDELSDGHIFESRLIASKIIDKYRLVIRWVFLIKIKFKGLHRG